LTFPDHPDHIFQLDEYQKDLGKAINRIALFLLKRSDQELYNQLQQDNGSDTDSQGRRNRGGGRRGSCPSCPLPGGARGAKVAF
jgi:hypothetical protein